MTPDEEIQALKTWIRVLNIAIQRSEARIQEICQHKFVWHPIAGEGQYCIKCGFRNYDCDD
jgi:hypothetical protein